MPQNSGLKSQIFIISHSFCGLGIQEGLSWWIPGRGRGARFAPEATVKMLAWGHVLRRCGCSCRTCLPGGSLRWLTSWCWLLVGISSLFPIPLHNEHDCPQGTATSSSRVIQACEVQTTSFWPSYGKHTWLYLQRSTGYRSQPSSIWKGITGPVYQES